MSMCMSDPDLSDIERFYIASYLLFPKRCPEPQEAAKAIEWFMTEFNHDNYQQKKNEDIIMDWDMDQWRIYAAFRNQYHIDLQKAEMHWFVFMGLLGNLQESSLTHVMDIRQKKITSKMSQEEKNAMAEEKNTRYRQLLNQMSPADLSCDVKRTLDTLRARGLKLAIGSSSKNTPFILERMGLDGFFDAVADGNCITHSKPNPEVFLKAAEMLGLKPEQCVVVEDAHAGVEAAKAGGFACAAMGDAKEDARATYHLGKLSDLLEYVG